MKTEIKGKLFKLKIKPHYDEVRTKRRIKQVLTNARKLVKVESRFAHHGKSPDWFDY